MPQRLDRDQIETWRAFLDAHALIVGAIERDLTAAGMPPTSWYEVLSTLERAHEGRMRIHELADAVLLSRSGLSRLLDRMESESLLIRTTCPSDRRGAVAAVTLTRAAPPAGMWPGYERGSTPYFLPPRGGDCE